MFTKALLPDTLRGIKLFSKTPLAKKAYLAGGSALTLHLGHRTSVDLDFFTNEEFDEQVAIGQMERLPGFKEK